LVIVDARTRGVEFARMQTTAMPAFRKIAETFTSGAKTLAHAFAKATARQAGM
jgi:hypothetical protein